MSPHLNLYEHLLSPTALAGPLLKGEIIKQDDRMESHFQIFKRERYI
jgi:hypothetical protein